MEYNNEYTTKDYLSRVNRVQKTLGLYEPLNEKELESYNSYKRINEVYSSNSLEGNTFTISETKYLLETGNVPENKSLKECNEITDLNSALLITEDYLLNSVDLDLEVIKRIHRYLTKSTLDLDESGSFRTVRNWIGGAEIHTSPPNAISKHLDELMEWYNLSKGTMNVVELAVKFSYRFVCIHPFVDGNGRMSRILMNYILRLNGYISISINPSKNKKKYYECLHLSDEVKDKYWCDPLIKLICDELVAEYNNLINTLEV
ncbi:MAG: Fic family protein [Clostridium sp.]